MKRKIVLLPMLFFITSVSAQIEGNVVDTSGKTISAAIIIAIDSASNKSDTTISDKTGYFEFKKLKRGNYKVVTTVPGYQNVVYENVVVRNETSSEENKAPDISDATWLEIVMKPVQPKKK